ncbi:MAG: NAD(P)-binding domain-containing protein [Polyangiaceae bacterium]|nr:NAD(P)-binding domain-containing protein [Polyangiaceae bacterium]
MSGEERSPASPPGEHKTLLYANLSDPRERTADPREIGRARTVARAVRTSDVTRFSAVFAATIVGIVAAVTAAFVLPPPGGHAAPGPLSRPHANAGLECSKCHKADEKKSSAADSCADCHGAHGSVRSGHARMLASRAMRCSTCHPIHQGDQGVTFSPGKQPVRFAPGVEVEVEQTSYFPPRSVTVPIVTVGACKACHSINEPRDPIARCLSAAQRNLGDAQPILCFDEHEIAHPDDALPTFDPRDPRLRKPGNPNTRSAGVCSAQHTTDRAVAWAAAREAAINVPVTEARKASGLPWIWLGSGIAGFVAVIAGVRGARFLKGRFRSKKPGTVPAEMLKPAAQKRLPTINTQTCIGCYACVDACPYNVLEVERYVAVVARPEACCGLVLCAQRCPNGSLTIASGETIGDRPRLSDNLESEDTPGLYLAGDVTGLPLIKNAILQGAHAVSRIFEASKKSPGVKGDAVDLLIVGAGPAGISAALRAKELGLSYEVIEQGTVAQSIQNFPRGKLVFDQPLDLPVSGPLWLKESTKEELLAQWLRIVRREQLAVIENTRMLGVHKRDDGLFSITTEPRDGGSASERRARFVLLAIGQRGSPRRLPIEIPEEVEDRVFYHLADARSFAGKTAIVVGLGDVAMETAIALARQPDTRVSVVYRGDDFSRGQGRNIQTLKRLVGDGKISLYFRANVQSIAPRHMTVSIAPPGARIEHLPYDAVFVMIGGVAPWATLRAAGVRTVGDGEGATRTLLSPGA